MGLSKETRIILFIAIDVAFFLLEIIVGYTAHSLALVADAFHMLNDVLSLCVGLWAVRVATKRASSNEYTYGWARAELLGGLVNGVFLIALCLSIVLDAIQRFVEPQEVKNPKLVLIVGGVGLAFNILGLFIFHEHSHSHDHDEEDGHVHSADELGQAEQGHGSHAHVHDHDHDHAHANGHETQPVAHSDEAGAANKRKSLSWGQNNIGKGEGEPLLPSGRRRSSVWRRHNRSGSRGYNTVDDIPIHPASLREGILAQARSGDVDSDPESAVDVGTMEEVDESTEVSPLVQRNSARRNSIRRKSHRRSIQEGKANKISHENHKHTQPRAKGSGGGHSHADMNLRGILLHVLGDALGNVGVMASALIIWLTPWSFRFYFDPAISLFITLIILKSAIPLVKDTAKPLLQAVPGHISVEDIKEDIESLPGIRECHHVHVWALTPSKLIATLDVNLQFDFEDQQGAARWMQLAEEIKSCLHAYGIHSSTIQPEFCTNEEQEQAVQSTLATNGSGTQASSDSTMVDSIGLPVEANGASTDGHGACLLDCKGACATGKQCCGPVSAAGSGTATPRRNADGDGHTHDHGKQDHGKHDHGKHDHDKHDHSKHDHSKHDHSKHDHNKHDHGKHDHKHDH